MPALTERLVAIGQQSRTLPRGEKTPFLKRAARELGMSLATLHRKLSEVTLKNTRKKRTDAGTTLFPFADAQLLSTVLMESHRGNGKRLMSIEQGVSMLESNGKINTRVIDGDTGEVTKLSTSTIARALRLYRLHPDQLNKPAPAIALASLHPNHCWQIDASLCVLYYLRREADTNAGLQVMERAEFYKNKPKNFARIENDRVWRYVVTDHYSGVIFCEYVLGAESGENLAAIFINAMQKRHEQDPFHGAPFIAMLDPGSANTGAIFKNLCRSMQVHVQINMPGNPRAKGQVEKANDMVERMFESGLKFRAVETLDALNHEVSRWLRVFNATAIHSRTKTTRYNLWLTIQPEQLRIPPDVATCRELAHSKPESRVVTVNLTISFGGQEFDVSPLVESAGVIVGDKVMVVKNPWRPEAAQVVLTNADGHDSYHVIEPVLRNEAGFRSDAVVINEGYARHPDTQAQRHAKDIEMQAMGVSTLRDAVAKRKGKALAFDGDLDPYKPVTDAQLPAYLPKRGTTLNVPATAHVEIKPLTHAAAAAMLTRLLPDWGREDMRALKAGWPDGVLPDDVGTVAEALRQARELTQERPRLALVS